MKMKKIILSIILVLFALNANAVEFTGNFSPEADCFVPAAEPYVLKNNAATEQAFTITSAGAQKEWINLEGKWIFEQPLAVTLAPNASKELFAFLKPQNCYVEPGTYPVTVQIQGQESTAKTISLKVAPIRTLRLEMQKSTAETTQCEQAEFPFSLQNTGKSDELVRLETEGIPGEWADFQEKEFLLAKGAKREMLLTIKPDCSAETKSHLFSLQAFLSGTRFFIKSNLSLAIKDAQKLELSSPTLKACNDATVSSQLAIKNTGKLPDTVQLRLEGADWIKLQKEQASLAAGEEQEIGIEFLPSSSEQGNYPFKVIARSDKFAKTTEFALTAVVADCFGTTVQKTLINDSDYNAGATVCMEEQASISTSINNNREKPITVSFTLEGAKGTIEPAQLTLEPNQTETIQIKLDFSSEEAGAKDFNLKIKAPQFEETQLFKLQSNDCYNLQADYGELLKRIDINAEDRKAFTVSLKNAGTKELIVATAVQGPSWVYFQPETRKLQPEQEEGVFLYISPTFDTAEGIHKAKITIRTSNFEESREIELNVYGGLHGLLGEARIATDTKITGVTEQAEKTVSLSVTVKNDGNSSLRITGLKAIGFSAEIPFTETVLEQGETKEYSIKLLLEKGFDKQQFVVPMSFSTDKGEIVKSIGVDLSKPAQGATGLFSLATAKDTLIILLVLIVVVLIVALALRGAGKEPSMEQTVYASETPEATEQQETEQKPKRKFGKRKAK